MLKENEVLRFARFVVTEDAAATFTQITVETQLSIRTPYVWQIKALQVEFKSGELEFPAQGAQESLTLQFTRESKAALINYDDADLLEKVTSEITRVATIGTDAGPAYKFVDNPRTFVYSTPIIFAGSKIFIGLLGTSGSATTVRGRVGYTIEKVSEKAFFRYASAL